MHVVGLARLRRRKDEEDACSYEYFRWRSAGKSRG